MTSFDTAPGCPGAYVVVRCDDTRPRFLSESKGGHWKNKDPKASREELKKKWVEGTDLLYIGKADRSLRERISCLVRFSNGRRCGHWGGRYLWQVGGCEQFSIMYKETPGEPASCAEKALLREFVSTFGKLPFANLRL
jgi:hypothetical protein